MTLIGENGETLYPTAQQVFACAFSGAKSVGGFEVDGNPIENLPEISFSRYPASPAARITGIPGLSLLLQLGVEVDGNFVQTSYSTDQVIIDERWYPIDTQAASEGKEWLNSLGMDEVQPITIGQLIRLCGAQNPPLAIIDESDAQPIDVASKAGQILTTIPGLNATLYPYQHDGVAFLRLVANQDVGCLLADEMGLGKTLQVIALLQAEHNEGRFQSLVIAPATLLENWRREISQFAPKLGCLIHSGPSRAGIAQRLLGYDVVITSFDTVIRDESLLSEIDWNLVAIDEAQGIKNPEAQRTLAVKKIPRRVSIAITGTPVENCLEDLWSISDFVLPGLLGTVDQFRSAFNDDIHGAGRLEPLVTPIMLRRRVSEVAKDLPAKIEILQPISMGDKLAEAYEALRKQTLDEYGPAAGMVATTRLRVLCTHPSLTNGWTGDSVDDVPKYQRLMEILGEIFDTNEKAIVFTSFQGMTDLMMVDVPHRWPQGFFRYIDGRVPVPLRQSTVDELYAHQGYGALFLNPKAAGTGLNITAANHVIHYNPEWNPALTAQATGRAYRRKQQRPVTIHHLYYADSVEEVMVNRADFKRMLAEEAITGHEGDVDPSVVLKALQISPVTSGIGEL